MEYDLVLPQHLRKKLKSPLGRLVSNLGEVHDVLISRDIISVGDKITESLLVRNILPLVCVYDGRIKRVGVETPEVIKEFDAEEIHIKNPAGHLSRDAFKAVDRALASGLRTKIIVDGEEDLITLAAVNLAPSGSLVLYGQPDEGVVVVEVDDNIKKKVKEILERMKPKNGN
ncbi:MAG: DUF359 domain-containing protein [Candidatus Altiarchaeota archaeon]|nr:DUF359 domain-containing protein [Candidatus Altiarchaeota archaeon]